MIAPKLVLEVVDSGTLEGTIVSIGQPTAEANQKWIVQPKGDGLCVIKPSYSSTLVLAIDNGGGRNGSQAVLETNAGKP